MTEHELCVGCKWNNYPTCNGTIMFDGNEMNIENLKDCFACGQKLGDNLKDFSITIKTEEEIKIDDHEERLLALESEKPIE